MTLLVDGLGYVAMGTPDLADAEGFFTEICQFEVSERRDDTVFLRGDMRHHWLRLDRREKPGLIRVGYEVRDSRSRDEIKERLGHHGVEWWAAGTMTEDRIVDAFRFHDPNGIEVELYEEMAQLPVPPKGTGIELQLLLHAVFRVDDVVRSRDFWRDVLDFRRSDQIEELACFMRCGNRYHHSVGFLRGSAAAGLLDHFCVLCPSIDDVMRVQNVAKRATVPMEHELLRHAASGSIGSYLQYPPLGLGVEYCTGHSQLEDDHPGRLLLAAPATVNVWNDLPTHSANVWKPSFENGSLGNVYELLSDQS
jgi:2,3-dihydroxy-p-cumate/2,3-dihydroxybenzoate 3,4-dioxygenase